MELRVRRFSFYLSSGGRGDLQHPSSEHLSLQTCADAYSCPARPSCAGLTRHHAGCHVSEEGFQLTIDTYMWLVWRDLLGDASRMKELEAVIAAVQQSLLSEPLLQACGGIHLLRHKQGPALGFIVRCLLTPTPNAHSLCASGLKMGQRRIIFVSVLRAHVGP